MPRPLRWLRDRLGITDAERSVARSERMAAETHAEMSRTTREVRESRLRLVRKSQDWPALYRDRLRDSVG